MRTLEVQHEGAAPTRTLRLWWAAAAYGLVAVVLGIVATVSYAIAGRTPTYPEDGPTWLDAWFQWDSGWYFGIAEGGYSYTPGQQSSIAFFPTYPMSMRGLGWLIGDDQWAGTLITLAAALAAIVLFARWARARLSSAGTLTAVALVLLFPYALFLYGAVYADALFLLTAIGAFTLLEARHYWLAGLVGALATAGRPVGIAVAVGLVVRVLELRAQDRDAGDGRPLPFRALLQAVPTLRLRHLGVLLSVTGLLAWCWYLWAEFNDPFAFVSVQSAPGWYQEEGPRTWFKVSFLHSLLFGPLDIVAKTLPAALLCLAAVLLLRRVWRRFGWGYLAYSTVAIAIPLIGSKDFMGTGRYLLAAFPVFAAAADLIVTSRPRWQRVAVLAVSACGLLVTTFFFARGVYLS